MKKLIVLILFANLLIFFAKAQFPNNVNQLIVKPNEKFTFSANLEQGFIMSDLSWASLSNVACFPATQNSKFSGNHVLYFLQMPIKSKLKITLIPEDKNANFSLYAYQIGINSYATVPNLTTCVSCEADYKWDYPKKGKTQDHTRTVELISVDNPYNVVIGVAGANGLTSGKYTLLIDLVTHQQSNEIQEPLKVYSVKCEKNKTLTYEGDLNEGVVIEDLTWASLSNVACFPATQNSKFKGNTIVYELQMPEYVEITIKVEPIDKDANLSLWAYQVATDNQVLPPKLTSCIACEADYKWDYPKKGKTQDHTRSVSLTSMQNPYRLVIGVVGATINDNVKFNLYVSTKTLK